MRTLPTPVVSLWIAGVVCVPVSAQRTAPADIVGCYDVTEGEWRPDTSRVWEFEGQSPSTFGRFEMWYTIPPRIEVSAEEDWLSRERSLAPPLFSLTTPPDAIPAPHNRAWWRQQGDTIFLALSNGFVGVGARLRATSDGLTGQVTTRSDAGGTRPWHRDVRLESVACDSPPPVSIDAMEPLPRAGGRAEDRGRKAPYRSPASRRNSLEYPQNRRTDHRPPRLQRFGPGNHHCGWGCVPRRRVFLRVGRLRHASRAASRGSGTSAFRSCWSTVGKPDDGGAP